MRLECSDRSNLVKMSDAEMDFGDTNDDAGETEQPSPSLLEEGEEEETQPPQVCTASLSHLRTMLPKGSSCNKPAQRPNHAT